MQGVDYVFHFAGIAPLPVNQENPYEAISANVAGTANVLDAARKIGVKRFIFASTSAIYENNTVFPSKENEDVVTKSNIRNVETSVRAAVQKLL